MKGDKEFSGLLSGFDDYVSTIPYYSFSHIQIWSLRMLQNSTRGNQETLIIAPTAEKTPKSLDKYC